MKSVSRYCTQFSQAVWVPLSESLKSVNPWSRKTCLTISGTVLFWKMRQAAVRVRNHSQGTSVAR